MELGLGSLVCVLTEHLFVGTSSPFALCASVLPCLRILGECLIVVSVNYSLMCLLGSAVPRKLLG